MLRLLRPGDRIVLGNDAYGGTFRLISKVYGAVGYPWTAADLTDVDALPRRLAPDTRMVWLETPTNPLLTCIDIEAVATLAHERGRARRRRQHLRHALPAAAARAGRRHRRALGDQVPRRPLRRGRRASSRSTTTSWPSACASPRTPSAPCPAPSTATSSLRGLKTLAVRMDRHCANARAVVDLLVGHPAVERVLYPQLPDHPGHAAAASRCGTSAGMVSFTLRGGEAAAPEVVQHTELFTLAESLGAVESLIEHPGRMTHASVAGSPLEVPDSLVRLSVGLESADDLVADLEQALERI